MNEIVLARKRHGLKGTVILVARQKPGVFMEYVTWVQSDNSKERYLGCYFTADKEEDAEVMLQAALNNFRKRG